MCAAMETLQGGQSLKVTRVTGPRGGSGHYQVALDDGTVLLARSEDLAGLNIRAEADLDGRTVQLLKQFDTSARARECADRLLGVRMRSKRELVARLRRQGFPQDIVATVVDELEGAGFINDTRFAEAWVRSRIALKPAGVARLRHELAQRGIARPVVDSTLAAALNRAGEEELALRLARARAPRYRDVPRQVATRRLAGVLQRRGFASGVIASVLRQTVGQSGDGSQE